MKAQCLQIWLTLSPATSEANNSLQQASIFQVLCFWVPTTARGRVSLQLSDAVVVPPAYTNRPNRHTSAQSTMFSLAIWCYLLEPQHHADGLVVLSELWVSLREIPSIFKDRPVAACDVNKAIENLIGHLLVQRETLAGWYPPAGVKAYIVPKDDLPPNTLIFHP
jgi:hypothetical protein